jgi:hypothetical protein
METTRERDRAGSSERVVDSSPTQHPRTVLPIPALSSSAITTTYVSIDAILEHDSRSTLQLSMSRLESRWPQYNKINDMLAIGLVLRTPLVKVKDITRS